MFLPEEIDAAITSVRVLRKGESVDVFGVEVHCYKRGWFAVSVSNGLKFRNAVMLIVNSGDLRGRGERVKDSLRV